MTTEEITKAMIETAQNLIDFDRYFLQVTVRNQDPEIVKARSQANQSIQQQTALLGELLQSGARS